MTNAPWQILAWNPVAIPATDLKWLAHSLRHLNTIEMDAEDTSGLRRGQALWGRDGSGHLRVAIAFEWGEVSHGVPTLADPMSIISNALFTDDRGVPMGRGQQVVYLNTLIHELPWQDNIPARHLVRKPLLWHDTLPRAA